MNPVYTEEELLALATEEKLGALMFSIRAATYRLHGAGYEITTGDFKLKGTPGAVFADFVISRESDNTLIAHYRATLEHTTITMPKNTGVAEEELIQLMAKFLVLISYAEAKQYPQAEELTPPPPVA